MTVTAVVVVAEDTIVSTTAVDTMTTEITAAITATDAVAIRAEAATIREAANTTDSIRGEEVRQNLSTFPDDRWFFFK